MEKIQFIVSDSDENQRIHKYLKKVMREAPASFIFGLLRKKDVRVNNIKIHENYLLNEGDRVVIYLTSQQKEDFIKPYTFHFINEQLNIVFEDENILVINKRQGLPVHSTNNEKEITLTNAVLTYLYNKGEYDPESKGYTPSPVSRIDQETTGVVIFSKKLSVHQSLAASFSDKESIRREYRLVVHGIINQDKETITLPLIKEEGVVYVSERGKATTTKYEVLKRSKNYTYVKAILLTGFSNQIRVHFNASGYPLVGDRKYGKKDRYPRLALNAYLVSFTNLGEPLQYLNGKKIIADDTNYLINILEEDHK